MVLCTPWIVRDVASVLPHLVTFLFVALCFPLPDMCTSPSADTSQHCWSLALPVRFDPVMLLQEAFCVSENFLAPTIWRLDSQHFAHWVNEMSLLSYFQQEFTQTQECGGRVFVCV